MKKLTVWLLCAAMLATLLTGCGGSGSGTAAASGSASSAAASGKTRTTSKNKDENAFAIGLWEKPNSIDPHLFALQVEDEIVMQVYEPLIFTMNDGSIADILAESHTVNEDGSVDFVLREGVKFHSGDTLKAEDVEYCLSRIENSPLLSTLYGMIEMEIQDDLHFKWTFPYAEAGASFEALMPYLDALVILNKSWAEEKLASPTDQLGLEEDGTGAYYFDSIADNGDVTLKRFADYHGEAHFDTIYMKIITGDTEMAFESGDLDMSRYKKSTYDVVSAYENVQATATPVNSVGFIINNCAEGKPTADLRVRQAIAYATNREELASVSTEDGGEVAYNLANPMVNYWADVADHFDQNLDTANQLMTEAGYSDSSRAEITIICMGTQTEWVSACEMMKEQLEQSYFTVTIEQVADTSRFMNGDFDLGFLSAGLQTDFASYQTLFTDLNIALYSGQDVQDAFANMKDEATTHEAMKVVTESLAYMPIFYPYAFFIYDGDLNVGPLYASFSGFLYKDFSWK